jgi:hypothetical protein
MEEVHCRNAVPENVSAVHSPFRRGERLRILGGFVPESVIGLELKQWTEVLHFVTDRQS